jgi:hypothetical protein
MSRACKFMQSLPPVDGRFEAGSSPLLCGQLLCGQLLCDRLLCDMASCVRPVVYFVTCCIAISQSLKAAEAAVDFSRDIRPLLASKCFACHGPDEALREGGLRLDLSASTIQPADSGQPAILPGRAAESELIQRVTASDSSLRMPPDAQLSDAEISLLSTWINQGAKYQQHWAFQPPVRPRLPVIQAGHWSRSPIDYFVLSKLEEQGLAPSPTADRATLIRRLYLDLLGLLPSTTAVEAFVEDNDPLAYERLVDELLASPHFGERWGRYWLDLARYGDSDGYLDDRLRPGAWVYRDWVINAINRDLPFDQFTIEQLAGDLLPNAHLEQKIATGFHRNTLRNTEAGVDREEYRVKEVVDRVSTTGVVWLGLTLGCAECHTHKYDPVTQLEFFQLYAIFNNAQETDISAPQSRERITHTFQVKKWQQELSRLTTQFKRFSELGFTNVAHKPAVPYERRLKQQWTVAEREPPAAFYTAVDAARFKQQRTFIKQLEQKPRLASTKAPAFSEIPAGRETFVHIRGDYKRPGQLATPKLMESLYPGRSTGEPINRLDLAKWLVDPSNPLPARVTVNYWWSRLFGRGIVSTPDDFGARGSSPSHPELLDWLALELIRSGWSRKEMIRQMVTSATYRQTSHATDRAQSVDPLNVWLGRQNRLRLEAEIIRDITLQAGGLLQAEIGGPSILPPLPDYITGISRNREWPLSSLSDRHKRGLYILLRRATPYPMLTTFDAPDSSLTCAVRERSNTPLQALTLLNDQVFFSSAQRLGARLVAEGSDNHARLHLAFHICLGRRATPEEMHRLLELLAEFQATLSDDLVAAQQIVGDQPLANSQSANEQAAWVLLSRVLLNLDSFFCRE